LLKFRQPGALLQWQLQPFLKQSKDFPFNFMDLGLNGKLALVTGSTTGIGAAIAEGLARERARVIVNGRIEYRVQKAIEAIKTRVEDAAVEGFAGDLSTAAAAEALDRFATPEEVANMVVYVGNAAASATNDSALGVDAGTVRSTCLEDRQTAEEPLTLCPSSASTTSSGRAATNTLESSRQRRIASVSVRLFAFFCWKNWRPKFFDL
jgi:nucleoside-diphosphate-sugar epimerase